MNDIPIRCSNGKAVGYVRGDTFYKTVSASKHFLTTPPGIGFDVDTLDAAERNGARFVQVTDRESGTMYRATLQQIRRKGFRVNRGFGVQLALALKEWSVNGAPLAEQLTLGGVL